LLKWTIVKKESKIEKPSFAEVFVFFFLIMLK